ncbi:MAG: hypothetical protein P794_07445 [Epsilonproteobacteria bacterium (ex Lamellibrachia satsuma)]|nr:MAG: hypothetical protein P794_07445 [Epsilonproteobacteria bacterium (ex Lamellibrachia satsuma)]
MSKQNFIRITLFVSVLAFNPAVGGESVSAQVNKRSASAQQTRTVTSSIANILHKRGLDEDAAKKISDGFAEENEALLALMIENIAKHCDEISRNEIFEYLSTEALHRKNVKLDSYAQLTHMFSRIKKTSPDKQTRKQLSRIAKHNSELLG